MGKIPIPYFRQNALVAQNGEYGPNYKCKKESSFLTNLADYPEDPQDMFCFSSLI